MRPDGRPSGRITALEAQRRRRGRLNLYLDGAFALALSTDVAARAGLHAGAELDEAALGSLCAEAAQADAMTASLRLLSYRPRSESELRQRLARRGAPTEVIEATVLRLRELKLVDDEAFARSWTEGRDRSSPRGRRLVEHELLAKGIARGAAREAVSAIDEEQAAARAAARRLPALRGLPREQCRRRLSEFLRRRGFGYETVRAAVDRGWRTLADGGDGS